MHKGYYFPDRFERIPPNPIQACYFFPPSSFARHRFSPSFSLPQPNPRIYYFSLCLCLHLSTYLPPFVLFARGIRRLFPCIVSFGSFLFLFFSLLSSARLFAAVEFLGARERGFFYCKVTESMENNWKYQYYSANKNAFSFSEIYFVQSSIGRAHV